MLTTTSTTDISNSTSTNSSSRNGGLSDGAEVGITVLLLSVLIFGLWISVVVYKRINNHILKKKEMARAHRLDAIELGARPRSTGLNAGYGVQDLRILECEIEATRYEARKCVCM